MSPMPTALHSPRRAIGTALGVGALVLALAGCGGGESAPAPDSAPPAAPAAAAPAAAPGAASSAPGPKISANSASEDELAQRFQQAGIPSAERWADEVAEYRPYPADDPNFGKLREELAKYNPGPGVVDQIVAVLQP